MLRALSVLATGLFLAFSGFASAESRTTNPCSLLTNAQVAPAIGGSVASRSLDHDYRPPACTWTGPPQGYMKFSQSLTLQIFHITKKQFNLNNVQSIPPSKPAFGYGGPAYTSNGGLQLWKNGIAVELDGSYANVFPHQAFHLAQIALKNLS